MNKGKSSGWLAALLSTLWAEIKEARLSWIEWACAGFLILLGFNGLFATGYDHHLKKFQRDLIVYPVEEEYKVYREWTGLYLFYHWSESRVVYVNRTVKFGIKAPGEDSRIEIHDGESFLVPTYPRVYLLEYRNPGKNAVLVNGDPSAFELYRKFAYD